MTYEARTVPNLIQGVSQQAAQQRRDTQCEAQFDCINSPVEGALARPGATFVKRLPAADFTGSFIYNVYRAEQEHYAVVVLDGDLKVYDLEDGTECDVSFPDGKAYLTCSGEPKNAFRATTVDDYTFVANREIKPAMGSATAQARPKEALLHFRAGNYDTQYQLVLRFNGLTYRYAYRTPDNSEPFNAGFIETGNLAATFYRALTNTLAPTPVNEQPVGSAAPGAGAATGGDPAGDGEISATSLGFEVAIDGNTLRLWRNDGQDFSVDTTDGAGGTAFIAIKDKITAFSKLPSTVWDGFTVKVAGEDRSSDDDYYVAGVRDGTAGGVWEETVGPGVKTQLDADTMPWQLVNTAYRTFEFKKAPWGERVAGDEESAKDPSFVGRAIEDLVYDNRRLLIETEGSATWSKTENVYVFFPDTVQTLLATAPVDVRVSGSRAIALCRRVVQRDESTFLWAQRAQFRVTSGQDPFKQDTVEVRPSTAYEFAERAAPCAVGQSLYFVSEPGRYAAVRDLFIADGKPRGDTDVTAHCPRYIPSGVTLLSASDTLGLLVAYSEATPSRLYVYNSLISDNQRVQSAWNAWRLPSASVILWAAVHSERVYLMLQRGDGVVISYVDISNNQTDEGHDDYLTRMDLKVSDEACATTFDVNTGKSTIELPYAAPEAGSDAGEMFVAVSEDFPDGYTRGRSFLVEDVSGHVVTVVGDVTAYQFYAGLRIRAEREDSEYHLRSERGVDPVERLQVGDVLVTHANTGYYRAEVSYRNGDVRRYEMTGRVLGDPSNVLDKIVIGDGQLKVPVSAENNAFRLRLINDSFLPSAWQTATYRVQATRRSAPQRS